MVSQLRRAVVSIPSNIAEGAAKGSDKEFVRFLKISLGSLSEVETQIIIAKRLNYIENIDKLESKVVIIRKIICGLIRYFLMRQGSLYLKK